jgi:hypothetical protein
MDAKVDFVGIAHLMPGTDGFTMAAFRADEVPVGTRLYTEDKPVWRKGDPILLPNQCRHFIVAVRRATLPEKVFVTSAYYANQYTDDELRDRNGDEYIADGWYTIGHDMSGEYSDLYMPLLNPGDEVVGWQEFPQWSE